MPSGFPIGTLDIAWTRRMLCAAEIIDAVTLAPVTKGVVVRAEGLRQKPRINASGIHYWLEEGNAQPQRIVVTALDAPYWSTESAPPVPPQRAIRIELAPRPAYPFPPGATAARGAVIASRFGSPQAVADASVRLQWSDGAAWIDAPTEVKTDIRGEFAAPLRLAPRDEPRLVDGGIAVRLRVRRGVTTRTSNEFSLRAGQVSPTTQPFAWDNLHP